MHTNRRARPDRQNAAVMRRAETEQPRVHSAARRRPDLHSPERERDVSLCRESRSGLTHSPLLPRSPGFVHGERRPSLYQGRNKLAIRVNREAPAGQPLPARPAKAHHVPCRAIRQARDLARERRSIPPELSVTNYVWKSKSTFARSGVQPTHIGQSVIEDAAKITKPSGAAGLESEIHSPDSDSDNLGDSVVGAESPGAKARREKKKKMLWATQFEEPARFRSKFRQPRGWQTKRYQINVRTSNHVKCMIASSEAEFRSASPYLGAPRLLDSYVKIEPYVEMMDKLAINKEQCPNHSLSRVSSLASSVSLSEHADSADLSYGFIRPVSPEQPRLKPLSPIGRELTAKEVLGGALQGHVDLRRDGELEYIGAVDQLGRRSPVAEFGLDRLFRSTKKQYTGPEFEGMNDMSLRLWAKENGYEVQGPEADAKPSVLEVGTDGQEEMKAKSPLVWPPRPFAIFNRSDRKDIQALVIDKSPDRPVSKPESAPHCLGLKWIPSLTRPLDGEELTNPKLADALRHKTEFTQQEWASFGVHGLCVDDFIVGHDSHSDTECFFTPAIPSLQLNLHPDSNDLHETSCNDVSFDMVHDESVPVMHTGSLPRSSRSRRDDNPIQEETEDDVANQMTPREEELEDTQAGDIDDDWEDELVDDEYVKFVPDKPLSFAVSPVTSPEREEKRVLQKVMLVVNWWQHPGQAIPGSTVPPGASSFMMKQRARRNLVVDDDEPAELDTEPIKRRARVVIHTETILPADECDWLPEQFLDRKRSRALSLISVEDIQKMEAELNKFQPGQRHPDNTETEPRPEEETAMLKHWNRISRLLDSAVITCPETMRVHLVRCNLQSMMQHYKLEGLRAALQILDGGPSVFFNHTLPNIIARAQMIQGLLHSSEGALPSMRKGGPSKFEIPRVLVASILCNMFLCTLPNNDFAFAELLCSNQGFQIAKLCCFLNYFARISQLQLSEPKGNLIFVRSSIPCQFKWKKVQQKMSNLRLRNDFRVYDEDLSTHVPVLPAFKTVGGGLLFRRCTPEETHICNRPELSVAMMVAPPLGQLEALHIRGAERFNITEKEGLHLEFKGNVNDPLARLETDEDGTTVGSIFAAVDAFKFPDLNDQAIQKQISTEWIQFDLDKAFVAFRNTEENGLGKFQAVSCGAWGLGPPYRGEAEVKVCRNFVRQLRSICICPEIFGCHFFRSLTILAWHRYSFCGWQLRPLKRTSTFSATVYSTWLSNVTSNCSQMPPQKMSVSTFIVFIFAARKINTCTACTHKPANAVIVA